MPPCAFPVILIVPFVAVHWPVFHFNRNFHDSYRYLFLMTIGPTLMQMLMAYHFHPHNNIVINEQNCTFYSRRSQVLQVVKQHCRWLTAQRCYVHFLTKSTFWYRVITRAFSHLWSKCEIIIHYRNEENDFIEAVLSNLSGCAKVLCQFHSSTEVLSPAVDLIHKKLHRIFIACTLSEVLVLFTSWFCP